MQRLKIALLYIDYFLCATILISQTFGYNGIVSIAFYATFVASFGLWLCTLTESVDLTDIIAMATILLAIINVFINGIAEHCDFTFEYVKKLIIFCCTVSFFSAARKISVSKTFFEFVRVLLLLTGAVFIFMYLTRRHQMHMLGGNYSAYLTFRFTNPNLTALFLCGMTMFLMISICRSKKLLIRDYIAMAVLAFEFVFIFQSKSRNAILPMALFVLGLFWCGILGKRIKLRKWMLVVVIILPLAMALIYLAVVNTYFIERVFGFISGEGKLLDARVVIWSKAIREFLSSPLIGAYYSAGNGEGFFQMHNTHIDVLTSYGAVVFVFLCVFLFMLLNKLSKEHVGRKNLSTIAFICMLLNGIGEAALFSGGLGIYLLAGIFLVKEEPVKPEALQ